MLSHELLMVASTQLDNQQAVSIPWEALSNQQVDANSQEVASSLVVTDIP